MKQPWRPRVLIGIVISVVIGAIVLAGAGTFVARAADPPLDDLEPLAADLDHDRLALGRLVRLGRVAGPQLMQRLDLQAVLAQDANAERMERADREPDRGLADRREHRAHPHRLFAILRALPVVVLLAAAAVTR